MALSGMLPREGSEPGLQFSVARQRHRHSFLMHRFDHFVRRGRQDRERLVLADDGITLSLRSRSVSAISFRLCRR